MKKWALILWAVVLMAFTCQKPTPVGSCVQGKVIRITCASTVVQVMNLKNNFTAPWKNTMKNGEEFQNVFSVANKCSFPAQWKEGDTFWFVLNEARPDTACAVCMMYDAPPPDRYNVDSIRDRPCR